MDKNNITLPEYALDEIRSEIQTALLKRGFLAPITVKLDRFPREGRFFIAVKSKPFQTIPVLFEEVRIVNFGGEVKPHETEEDVLSIWVSVYADLTHFKGGGNMAELFDFKCKYSDRTKTTYAYEVRG